MPPRAARVRSLRQSACKTRTHRAGGTVSSSSRAAWLAVLALPALLVAAPFLGLLLAAAFFLSPSFVVLLGSRLSGATASPAASESACADNAPDMVLVVTTEA